MDNWLSDHEMLFRLTCFIAVFTCIGLLEWYFPRRRLTASKAVRWGNNLTIVLVNNVLMKLVMPLFAIDAALLVQRYHLGLLPWLENFAPIHSAIAIIFCLISLDAAIYLQHRLFHHVPLLWRLHRMHHSDVDIDVTTGIRFHPIEIWISMLIKIVVVLMLGAPVTAVILFEVLLNLTAMFNHGNIRLPQQVDRLVRYWLVTPDMHRVHHSIDSNETNSNFGFCLSWWDRIFSTYQAQPKAGHSKMTIGLPYFREQRESLLHHMLTQPFRNYSQK